VAVNVADRVKPAASRAVTVITFEPTLSGMLVLQLVVPDAVPLPPRLFLHVT
jgi:hypothetical protein